MEALKNSFERLKQVIISSNPNPWYGAMTQALNDFETEFNAHLASLTPAVSEPAISEPEVAVKTTKKKTEPTTTPAPTE